MISQNNVFGYQVPDSQHANSEKMLCTINSMNEICKHLNEDLSAGSNRRIKRRRGGRKVLVQPLSLTTPSRYVEDKIY